MSDKDEVRVPVVEERVALRKDVAETGRVTVSTRTHEREEQVREPLLRENVQVERVPVDRIVEEAPEVREEGGRLVVPVFEEVLVKRYRVTEDVHLTKERREETFEDSVTLRRTEVSVDRD